MPATTAFGDEVAIDHGDTFLVTGRDGQVRSGRHGLYHRDVRYLSGYSFTLNGLDPVLLVASNADFHRSAAASLVLHVVFGAILGGVYVPRLG